MGDRVSNKPGPLSTASSQTVQAKFSFEDETKGDSRYLNNRHLIKKRVIIGSICIAVFILGLLLGAFSWKPDKESTGVCRLSTSGIHGTLDVHMLANKIFNINGTLEAEAAGKYYIRIEESGNPSNCSDTGLKTEPSIKIKSEKTEENVTWKSSDVPGGYLFGRVLKLCGSNRCSCCIIARRD